MGKFNSQLKLVLYETPFCGRPLWKLLEPLVYWADGGAIYKVPAGFITDLGSVPQVFYLLLKPTGAFGKNYAKSTVLHDYLLTTNMPKIKAHDLFKEALVSEGVYKWLAHILWTAVNHEQKKKQKKPPTGLND